MAAETHYNDNGTWRKLKEIHYNDNGTWRKLKEVWYNDNGTWRKVFSGEGPVVPLSGGTSIMTANYPDPAYCGFSLETNGDIYRRNNSITYTDMGVNWYAPNVTNIGSSYYYRRISGGPNDTSGMVNNTWYQGTSSRSWYINAPGGAELENNSNMQISPNQSTIVTECSGGAYGYFQAAYSPI